MKRIVCGVDQGIEGGISVFDGEKYANFEPPFMFQPERYARGVLKQDEIREFQEGLKSIFDCGIGDIQVVMAETPQIHAGPGGNSLVSVSSIWWYAAIIDTFFRVQGLNIEYVNPVQWHGAILDPWMSKLGIPRPSIQIKRDTGVTLNKQWKAIAVRYAEEELGADFSGCIKSGSEGFADAMCIAQFAHGAMNGTINFHRVWTKPKQKKTPRKGGKS